ncbi:uncharacterized protein LOC116303366 [Actinia tenebrosa]|uniref:Uncharacterized protein LOC116303366 n=1 Tax=Actinia tenebrosa TaxID=6105 RepID=A0A6P8IPH9_ACTTE|nr:uncharacterized protein LOC116303366 [Actinia tenebrosa]XP_031568767.1 uncharacterized protein LOC116303366 [Actinia tenebrosa]
MKFTCIVVIFLVFACTIATEARRLEDDPDQELLREYEWLLRKRFQKVEKRSCIAVGGSGCDGNNAKCCRKGNPYTGTMRKCVNVGSFMEPNYTCKE